jgi:formylglycine-generating enzyme required for sulfatase activity
LKEFGMKKHIGTGERGVLKSSFQIILLAILCIFSMSSFGEESVSTLKHFQDCGVCSEMVVIPAGDYMMGATEEEFAGEKEYLFLYRGETPRHPVSVKKFGIAKFDVTKQQFSEFAKETNFNGKGCTTYNGKWWLFDPRADWENPGFAQSEQDPVVCVSWNDAQKFITWLNSKLPDGKVRKYRLPTEEEWEYAARAGTTGPTYWDGDRSKQCSYANARDISAQHLDLTAPYVNCDDGYVKTSPVGTFRANPWGLYDMLGNATQWVFDCGYFSYSPDPIIVLYGDCTMKSVRGSSWATIPIGVRSASRNGYKAEVRRDTVGFRLAVDL